MTVPVELEYTRNITNYFDEVITNAFIRVDKVKLQPSGSGVIKTAAYTSKSGYLAGAAPIDIKTFNFEYNKNSADDLYVQCDTYLKTTDYFNQ